MNKKNETAELINQIVELEWKQFQGVHNEGGRASCQDDRETFDIMRKSQFLAWDDEVVESYWQDLQAAEDRDWNLLTEKYARMMESTAPQEYANLASALPVRSEKRLALQEEILNINVGWEEDFAANYPNVSGTGRKIHTYEDTPFDTSAETYARGELGTYSDETVEKYYHMCCRLKAAGESLSVKTLLNMVKFYGYETIEEAEAQAKKQE